MSKDTIRIKGLADVRLRSDGEEIWLTFLTSHKTKVTIVVPGSEMRNLSFQMRHFDRQAQIKRELPPDPDKPTLSFDAPPPMFFVSEMQGVVRDGTALDLQLRDALKHEIQVCLLPATVSYLFQLLLQTQKLDDDQKPN
jgi:hypothetical protein